MSAQALARPLPPGEAELLRRLLAAEREALFRIPGLFLADQIARGPRGWELQARTPPARPFLDHRTPNPIVCDAIASIARTLDRAHRAADPRTGRPLGYTHQELRRENILIGPDRSILLLDRGAHRLRGELPLGRPGSEAPELRSGQPWSAETDIYALGELLLSLLGGAPLGGEPGGPHDALVQRRIAAISLPHAGMASLLRWMLAASPGARPSGMEVSHLLTRYAHEMGGVPTALSLGQAPLVSADARTTLLRPPAESEPLPPSPEITPDPAADPARGSNQTLLLLVLSLVALGLAAGLAVIAAAAALLLR